MIADPDTIIKTLDEYKKETLMLEEQVWDICFHMKGVTLHEAWLLSADQRARMFKFLKKKLGSADDIV